MGSTKKIIFCFSLFAVVSLQAQEYNFFSIKNRDYNRFNFGILAGYNQPWYHIVKSDRFIQSDTFWSVTPLNGSGISLAILFEWNINQHIQLRTNLAKLVLDNRTVKYHLQHPGFRELPVEKKSIETPYLQWPLIVKIQSDKIDEIFRVYLLLGGMLNIDIGDKKLQTVRSLIINNNDWGIIAGIGFHFYLKTGTLSTQIEFSVGMSNVAEQSPLNKFNQPIQELYNRSVSLSFILSP